MEQEFQKEVITRLTIIETKLDDYSSNKEKTNEAYTLSKENQKQIEEIKEKMKWNTRTVLGAIITGIVAIGLAVFKTGLGM